MEQWDLRLGEKIVGKVSCMETDRGFLLSAVCPEEEGYIYRVALDIQGEDPFVAGVMMPQKGEFRLDKRVDGRFSPARVQGAFLLRSRPGEYTGWSPLPFPLEKFGPFASSRCPWGESLLGRMLSQGTALVCEYDGRWYGAALLEKDRPFSLAPFFQKVTPLEIGGKHYGLVSCDGEGQVFQVHNVKKPGEY